MKLGLWFTPACKRPLFTVLRICSESPLLLHSINSVMIQSRFASRIGDQRIAAMPNFRAYTTAIRAGAHNLGP
jgi:hypothetical protein